MPRSASTAARGYGYPHQKERARWAPTVAAGNAVCHARVCLHTTRWIRPGAPWDLGHNEQRTAWTGPEHQRCNRADGGNRSPYGHRYRKRTHPTRPNRTLPTW